MSQGKILIIDDTPSNIALLTETLEPLGYEIFAASGGEQGLKVARRAAPDVILLDIMMPGRDGYAICRDLKEDDTTSAIPVIFITAKHETAATVKGFRAGAVDYILKPFQSEEVVSRVETHLRIKRLIAELCRKNEELELQIGRTRAAEKAKRTADEKLTSLSARESDRWGLAGFVGKSRTLRKILLDIERLQEFGKTSVLITGESGTGKELVARAIHHRSPRVSAPFVPVNCVAIPAELAESMLFGHQRGAFTGAVADRKGYFELADGGTLFLDEIGDMPLPLQAKLLRVLEDGCVTPIGSSEPRVVDVRVLAATNADFTKKVAQGEFRQDLYFRLARFTVETPPLRERKEDIPLLARHFLRYFAEEMGRPVPILTDQAATVLESYPFPGNVRELKNIIERALIESGGDMIQPSHFRLVHFETPVALGTSRGMPATTELSLNLEEAEQALIRKALQETGGNVAEAARLLGVNRSRIYRRIPSQLAS